MKQVILIFIFYFSITNHSNAYLDPGTGSVIVQAIVAVLAGAAAVMGNFWAKIKSFYLKIIPSKKKGKK